MYSTPLLKSKYRILSNNFNISVHEMNIKFTFMYLSYKMDFRFIKKIKSFFNILAPKARRFSYFLWAKVANLSAVQKFIKQLIFSSIETKFRHIVSLGKVQKQVKSQSFFVIKNIVKVWVISKCTFSSMQLYSLRMDSTDILIIECFAIKIWQAQHFQDCSEFFYFMIDFRFLQKTYAWYWFSSIFRYSNLR